MRIHSISSTYCATYLLDKPLSSGVVHPTLNANPLFLFTANFVTSSSRVPQPRASKEESYATPTIIFFLQKSQANTVIDDGIYKADSAALQS
jgi:hypothetical protein